LDRERKKQIKADEFVTVVERSVAWLDAHRDESRVTVGVLVVVAAALAGVVYFTGTKRREAEREFASALQTFGAPIASAQTPDSPTPAGKVYPNAQEKFAEAAAAFDGLARKFPSRAEGVRAKYLAAISRLEGGQYAEAEKELNAMAGRREAGVLEPALARLALAELYRRTGKTDQAVELYREFAADPASAMPRDFALMSLASTLEDARKIAEARASYRRLLEEFPSSVYAAEARRRADRLDSAVQG
jgi:tetratricopeptide (TPR) repeat protein